MTQLYQASAQFARRPADERFVSLTDMQDQLESRRKRSKGTALSSRSLRAVPQDNYNLEIQGPSGAGYTPTHWAFGQLCQRVKAPAKYLRTLPAPMVADALNFGLMNRDIEDIGVLIRADVDTGQEILPPELQAVTGPNYGRIWNVDIVRQLVRKFGNGLDGRFRVPGEFGKAVQVTKENTTLYCGDRDMFVFLADETNRVELPNRRNGQSGSLARGFFIWNSEVGDKTFGLGTFLFDYACCNRIVWGAEQYSEVKIRHTVSAPDKFLEQVQPALAAYAESSVGFLEAGLRAAQAAKVDAVEDFLSKRFGPEMVNTLMTTHTLEEQRPIETLWDVATAATAVARGYKHQDTRVALERQAGEILGMVMEKPRKMTAANLLD